MTDLTFSGDKAALFDLVRFDDRKQDCAWLKSRLQSLELQLADKQDMRSLGRSFAFSRTLVHNDLLAGNLLLSNDPIDNDEDGITIIDYEYGSFGHRGFDMGNHFNGTICFLVTIVNFIFMIQRIAAMI